MNREWFNQTEVEAQDHSRNARVAGPAWAVIVVIALVGMILVALEAIDLAATSKPNVEHSPSKVETIPSNGDSVRGEHGQ